MTIHYRDHLIESDRQTIEDILKSTAMFSREEIDVALELVDEGLTKGTASGYHFLLVENDNGEVLGYTCFGPIPCTRDSYDLYWIAIRHDLQGKGIGKNLLKKTQRVIAKLGGERVYIETSSRSIYEPTRGFYLRSGYRKEALLKNFYSKGDDKIVYFRKLSTKKSS
ncbi:MAG TPA: GNAT family N-acetyltransferase [Deltaproteobacteria bacterium]|nr:GNAT family N-acetyltransferase [Deltaproteobacteria bacterium]